MSQPIENKIIIDGQTYYGGLNQPNLKFIKVNVDCWERIFDLLSLRDLLAMGQTCQRMRQIGGHYFREKFHGTACELSDSNQPKFYTQTGSVELERDEFLRFIDIASIYGELSQLIQYLNSNLLESLTTIRLWYLDLNEHEIAEFTNNQRNNTIECIELFVCTIYDNSLRKLLQHCPNVKCLRIERNIFETPASCDGLFHHIFPNLQQLQYSRCAESNGVAKFLERNPSIKCFSTDANDLWTDRHAYVTSNIQLNCLSIEVYSNEIESVAIEFMNLLRTLFQSGFYKKLQLVVTWPLAATDYRGFLNEMMRFDALDMLCTYQFHGLTTLSMRLKELHILDAEGDIGLVALAKNLNNLERLWIQGPNQQIILPFLRHSKALKLALVRLTDGETLNLTEMNQEREKLEHAAKVLIGVRESIYLTIQCSHRQCNSKLIEITREETVHQKFQYISQFVEV